MLGSKIGPVVEIHVDQPELHDRARNLCAKTQRNTLVRLNVNDQAVGLEVSNARVAEKHERRTAKLDDDLRHAPRQALAGAKIKRHARPTPVVDEQLHGDKCFRVRIGRDVRFTAIAHDALAVIRAASILAAHHVGEYLFRTQGLNGMKHFGLFVADFVGLKRNRRLHGGHGEQLEEMIWHHVAKRSCGLVKRAAMFHANTLRGGDLHVIHVIAVPERLDDVVGKAKNHHVLYGLFAQIVIDAVNLLFRENLFQLLVELFGRIQIMAKGLFHDNARPAALFLL